MTVATWTARVRERFDRAAADYDRFAEVQHAAACQLAETLERLCHGMTVRKGLEIGCGTGFLSEQLVGRFPDADWTITDLAPGMVRRCEARLAKTGSRTVVTILDGQTGWGLGDSRFDLVASNLSFQWFRDLAGSVRGWTGRLQPGGRLVFNLPGFGSFQAWTDAFREDPDTPPPPTFPRGDEIREKLKSVLPESCEVQVTESQLGETYPGLRQFFEGLKRIGANTPLVAAGGSNAGLKRWLRRQKTTPVSINYELLTVVIQTGAESDSRTLREEPRVR